jgi:glycosyltransferase involved in cell wall biosynthesis
VQHGSLNRIRSSAATQYFQNYIFQPMSPIKIAQIIESTGGGSGRHVVDVLTALAKDPRFEVHLIHSLDRIEDRYLAGVEQLAGQIKVHEVKMVRQIKPLVDWQGMWSIHRYLRQQGPFQAVHLHSAKAGAIGAVAARLLGTPRVIFTPHAFYSMGLSGRKRRVYQMVEKICGLVCHKLIAVSGEESSYMLSNQLIAKSKLRIIPNGIEPIQIAAGQARGEQMRARLGVADTARLIGSIGRLTPQKNPLMFVEMVARRAQRYSAAEECYLMVGDGALEPEVLAALDSYKIRDRVLFLGFRSDVDDLLAALDIFVLNSLYEGMPYIILEAMAHKLPIVSTDVQGVRDPLRDGGLLVPIGDVGALDKALDQLVDPQLCQEMGLANRQRLEKNYSIEVMMQSLINLYLN